MDFKKIAKQAWKKSWKVGGIIGAVAFLVSWLVQYLQINPISVTFSTINVHEQVETQGMLPVLGNKIIDFIQGVIPPFSNTPAFIVSFIAVVLGGIITYYVGTFVHEIFQSRSIGPIGKSKETKIALRLFIGTFILSIGLIFGAAMNAIMLLVALFMYYVVISFVMSFILAFFPEVEV